MICEKCGAGLHYNIIGNIIDYRHSGGGTQCSELVIPHLTSLVEDWSIERIAA